MPDRYNCKRDVSGQLLSLVFSMTEDTLEFIPAGASADHPSVRSAESLISVYKAMGQKSGSSDIEEKVAVLQEKLDSLVK